MAQTNLNRNYLKYVKMSNTSRQIINLGTIANDGTGTKIRVGGGYINTNFLTLFRSIRPLYSLQSTLQDFIDNEWDTTNFETELGTIVKIDQSLYQQFSGTGADFDDWELIGEGAQLPDIWQSTGGATSLLNPEKITLSKRFEQAKNANQSSDNNVTLGDDGNVFKFSDTTNILKLINNVGWQEGSVIYLIVPIDFEIYNNVTESTSYKSIQLASGQNFKALRETILCFIYENGVWKEQGSTSTTTVVEQIVSQNLPFVFTVKTDNAGSSTSTQFKLPLTSSGTYDFTIDWGDNTVRQNITAYNSVLATHTYSVAGTYTISIYGKCYGWYFNNSNDKLKILDISKFGNGFRLGNSGYSFYGCSNLTISATDKIDLTGTSTLIGCFQNCTSLNSNTFLNNSDTSTITNMQSLFQGCTSLNKSFSFNTSFVTNMQSMFSGCTAFNSTLTFTTNNVQDFSGMFYNCPNFNQTLSFNTQSATNMYRFFGNCTNFNSDVNFITNNVVSFAGMFLNCSNFNKAISFNTIAATDMSQMFQSCAKFNQAVLFNTSNVTNMQAMFYNCYVFNQILNFDTSKVINMSQMLMGCYVFNQILSWNTQNVTNMSYLFGDCLVFNQPIAFNTIKVSNFQNMFYDCLLFNQDISGLNYTAATNMSGFFQSSSGFSRTNYDLLLISLASQNVQNNISILFNNTTKYTLGGAAEAARTHLISTHSWTIVDGGGI